MSDAAYQYTWYFGDGKKSGVSLTGISACHAYITSEENIIADCTREEGEPFREFLRRLTAEIVKVTKPFSEKEANDIVESLFVRSGSDAVGSAYFPRTVKILVNGMPGKWDGKEPLWDEEKPLNGSYLQFSIDPSNTGDTGMNDSTDPKNGDARKIICGAIERSCKKCVIFTGAPGTGKTYFVEKYADKRMAEYVDGEGKACFKRREYFVQFHSSYDYPDFVEGLRPIPGNGSMEFVRMDGIFKAFCRKVVELNKKNSPESGGETSGKKPVYYFVIDEINRADLGRVFGELMYCFEKRGERRTVATQYENLPACGRDGTPIPDDCFRDGFYIPENVVIIGTMNDIDRSVETFDFALRRRFDWVEIDANTVMKTSLESMKKKGTITGEITPGLVTGIEEMNRAIAAGPGLSKAFAIGPSYFEGYGGKSLEEIWECNIEPILREYVRGRDEKTAKKFIGGCENALFRKNPQPGEQE